jgi:hypothetical protein
VKFLEIRDRATFIPCFAFCPSEEGDEWLARRAGYGMSDTIIFGRLDRPNESQNDPYQWPSMTRTMHHAHRYVQDHFYELKSGDVVDVEFILGEKPAPKKSEREDGW